MFADLDWVKSFVEKDRSVPTGGEWDEDLSEIAECPVQIISSLRKTKVDKPEIIISLQGAD